MRAGVVGSLCGAVVTSLLLAVPASASHHPPNAVAGLVSMTVSSADNDDLVFNYTVTQQPCPNPSCDINYGKPYGIQVYVDAKAA